MSLAFQVNAQSVDEAIRYSWLLQQGTARNVATGGVMASLGGDITAAHVNPAGIGLFKTGELVISPGMGFNGINSATEVVIQFAKIWIWYGGQWYHPW